MDANRIDPAVEIKSLNKTYFTKDGPINVLDRIDLRIDKGEIFGIIGMSGAGKSTLVRCINYLEKPTSGTIIVNGRDLSTLTEKQLRETRQTIGMVFQQFNLLMQRTAEENICFPLEIAGVGKKEARERARELLEIVRLSDKANSYPSELSGGQKQRVAIARALATNPNVLLCDEATSALDPTTTRSILALLKDINKRLGITIVIITHEMGVIEEICDRVAIIDNGRIAETGSVEEIFARPQTNAAKRLVYTNGEKIEHFIGNRCLRIVFNGNSSYDPILSDMVLACKAPVNILHAETADINGKAFGELVIQLPDESDKADRIRRFLQAKELTVEEVIDFVG